MAAVPFRTSSPAAPAPLYYPTGGMGLATYFQAWPGRHWGGWTGPQQGRVRRIGRWHGWKATVRTRRPSGAGRLKVVLFHAVHHYHRRRDSGVETGTQGDPARAPLPGVR